MKTITKNIISPDLVFTDLENRIFDRHDLCNLIDRWKYLLVSKGAKRGNSLGVSMVHMDANHVAILFAAAELGLKLVILDKPVVEETIHRTKAALFSPIDFHIICKYMRALPIYMKMSEKYCIHNISDNEIDQVFDTYEQIDCMPGDSYLQAASSGSTGEPTPYEYSHEECYDLIYRLANVLKYEQTSRVCHTRNMNHVSAMLVGILPMFVACDNHFVFNIYHDARDFPKFINENKIDRVFIGSEFVMRDLVNNAREQNIRFDTTVIATISGFPLSSKYIDYCRDLNMEIMSHIGAVGIGIVVVNNHITENSIHEDNLLGVLPDDFYQLQLINGKCWVSCKTDNYATQRLLEDDLRYENGKWYYDGRSARNPLEDEIREVLNKNCNIYLNYLVIWDSDPVEIPDKYKHLSVYYLSKELWTTETKVNAYQLRSYLDLQEELKSKGLPLSIQPSMKESAAAMKNTA